LVEVYEENPASLNYVVGERSILTASSDKIQQMVAS